MAVSSNLRISISQRLYEEFYINFDQNRFFEFTPIQTRVFNIYLTALGGDSDPELYVYNGNILLAYNDDYNGDIHSFVSIELFEGITYNIKCKMTNEDYCGTLRLLIE